jgi:hypothetical protein
LHQGGELFVALFFFGGEGLGLGVVATVFCQERVAKAVVVEDAVQIGADDGGVTAHRAVGVKLVALQAALGRVLEIREIREILSKKKEVLVLDSQGVPIRYILSILSEKGLCSFLRT